MHASTMTVNAAPPADPPAIPTMSAHDAVTGRYEPECLTPGGTCISPRQMMGPVHPRVRDDYVDLLAECGSPGIPCGRSGSDSLRYAVDAAMPIRLVTALLASAAARQVHRQPGDPHWVYAHQDPDLARTSSATIGEHGLATDPVHHVAVLLTTRPLAVSQVVHDRWRPLSLPAIGHAVVSAAVVARVPVALRHAMRPVDGVILHRDARADRRGIWRLTVMRDAQIYGHDRIASPVSAIETLGRAVLMGYRQMW